MGRRIAGAAAQSRQSRARPRKNTGLEDYFGWIGANFDASITWDDVAWVREHWDGPLIIKGILEPDDARAAIASGADGIVVSNHGGRQLDGVPSSARALPLVAEAVGGKLPILVDGGVPLWPRRR